MNWGKRGRREGGEGERNTTYAVCSRIFYPFGIRDVIMTGLAVKKCPGEREWKN